MFITERFSFISENETRLHRLELLRRAMLSKPFMVLLVIGACAVTVFRGEFVGLLIYAAITALALVACDELIATTLPFMLLSCFMIKCFDSFSTYIKIIWLAPFAAAIIISHFVLYPKPWKTGSAIWSLIGVTAAVTLGGLGKITVKEYFSLTSIYYILGLGVAMIIIYLIAYSYLESTENTEIHRTFAYIMYLVGIFACAMVLLHYAMNFEKVMKSHSILEPQWRNNISTFIMLSMPFGFYLSIKQPHCIIAALLTMPCLVLTSSRGGLLFGAAEFGLCCIYIIYADKKHRTRNLVVFSVCALVLICYAGDILAFISKTLARFGAETISTEPRAGLIQRAVEDFRSNPLFGRGIGYMGNRDIHPSKTFAACWYHSSPFQIIGSFGVLGIIAFTFQFFMRCRVFWSRITFFTLSVYISYLGILMMSLVNPGEFCPIPYEFIVVFMFALIEQKCPVNHERVLFGAKRGKKENDEEKTEAVIEQ